MYVKALFPLYLTGGAKLKYQCLSEATKDDWVQMATALAKKFKTEAIVSNGRDELHHTRQGKESVALQEK